MVSRHESAKIIASFHCVLDVFCRSCGPVYCSGCVPLFHRVSFDVVSRVVVGCAIPWEHA